MRSQLRSQVGRLSLALGLGGMALSLGGAASAVTIDWTFVGDPGNAADSTSYGSVASGYNIGTYEVTNAQYAEFLNAVADTDTNALYNTSMGSGYGGITRTGSSGSYTYSAIVGREDMPVNFVSFYDSLRYCELAAQRQLTGCRTARRPRTARTRSRRRESQPTRSRATREPRSS